MNHAVQKILTEFYAEYGIIKLDRANFLVF
jgi:hypothetical protein